VAQDGKALNIEHGELAGLVEGEADRLRDAKFRN